MTTPRPLLVPLRLRLDLAEENRPAMHIWDGKSRIVVDLPAPGLTLGWLTAKGGIDTAVMDTEVLELAIADATYTYGEIQRLADEAGLTPAMVFGTDTTSVQTLLDTIRAALFVSAETVVAENRDSYEDRTSDPHQLRMRGLSGRIDDDRGLVAFLYELARDHLTIGHIEGIARDVEKAPGVCQFTNGWLAQWAQDLAGRLTEGTWQDPAVRSELAASLLQMIVDPPPNVAGCLHPDDCRFVDSAEDGLMGTCCFAKTQAPPETDGVTLLVRVASALGRVLDPEGDRADLFWLVIVELEKEFPQIAWHNSMTDSGSLAKPVFQPVRVESIPPYGDAKCDVCGSTMTFTAPTVALGQATAGAFLDKHRSVHEAEAEAEAGDSGSIAKPE